MRARLLHIAPLLLAGCGAGPAPEPTDPKVMLARACDYLTSQQADDGGWHSETYGLARSGQAWTPFVLHALLEAAEFDPAVSRPDIGRALDFIRRHTNEEGVLGLADPDVPEYPNYATAFALRCLVRAGGREDQPLVEQMRTFLAADQFRPENGYDETSLAYGSWGFGGARPEGSPGHLDLSHTLHVLQALREAELSEPDVYERAQVFLRLVQRHPDDARPQPPVTEVADENVPFDGGFYFSPVVLEANKGALVESADGSYFESYASATCDGVLSLLEAGVAKEDERVRAAREWLQRHPRLDYPEGIPEDDPEAFGDAIYFYHLAARAEAYEALDWPGDWRDAMSAELAPLQRSDGSFINTRNHLMKEDDPLLATALAVIALSRAAR